MSKKYEKPDRNPEETEDVRQMTGEAKRTLYLGIKGCPADLFLTEKAKRILMAQGDCFKESLLDSAKPHDAIRQKVAPSSDGTGSKFSGTIEFKDEEKKGIPRFLRRIFDAIRKPCTCLNFPRKRNKVGIVFDDIQSH